MMKGRLFPLPRYINTPIVFLCLLMIAIAIVAAVRSGELPHAYMDEREFLTIFFLHPTAGHRAGLIVCLPDTTKIIRNDNLRFTRFLDLAPDGAGIYPPGGR
jgi:hypothetical protein